MNDHGTPTDAATLHADAPAHDVLRWRAVWKVEKYDGDWTPEQIAAADAPAPFAVIEREGNLLMYGGVSCLWQCLIGNGTATAGQTLTYFNNGNAYLGVGDSTTAAAATQTDLWGQQLRKAMDATYPQHTDATSSGAASIVFKSTFGSSDANFAWQEWGVFNGSSGGRMLNRKVESLGTKAGGTTWALTVTLSIA